MIKIAIIRKRQDGYYVLSEKGKNLGGPYKTHSAAKARLNQVEMFKHMKKNKKRRKKSLQFLTHLSKYAEETQLTYSSVMRDLRHNYDPEVLNTFMKSFKSAFDEAFIADLENPAEVALLSAIQEIQYSPNKKSSHLQNTMTKLAQSVLEMGDPPKAGKGIAAIIKFITKRISPVSRGNSLANLRNKILGLDANQIASKKTPPTASLGQSITLIKTILSGYDPLYIRSVIEEIVRNL